MGQSSTLRVPLRIVFYREGGDWIAHCLEFDLMGDGPSKEEALKTLSEAIALQVEASIEFKNKANLFSPADGKYFAMFAAGSDVVDGVLEISFRAIQSISPMIDKIEAREYGDAEAKLALV